VPRALVQQVNDFTDGDPIHWNKMMTGAQA
jgi:hypothetical protein